MTTAPHLRGQLHRDEAWEERKGQMAQRTLAHLTAKKNPAQVASEPVQPTLAAPDPLACDADCPECGGEGLVDHTESGIMCPKYAARKIMAEGANL